MARFRLSHAAKRDLLGIGRYTRGRWGEMQCRRYLVQLDARFHALSVDPESGRTCDEIKPGYRRAHEGKHVVFYRLAQDGCVEIIRVLHERMLPELHL